MESIVPVGTDKQDEKAQCDERCHQAGLDNCDRCNTGEWDLICNSCRYYGMQDGA